MCLIKGLPAMAKVTKSPRSPWRRPRVQELRPRLNRRIVPSARVNLNAYWNKLEQFSNSLVTFDKPKLSKTSLENEINENLSNELQELSN